MGKNQTCSISSSLREISADSGVPLSTLKSCSKALREMGLVDFGDFKASVPASTTCLGDLVLEILEVD